MCVCECVCVCVFACVFVFVRLSACVFEPAANRTLLTEEIVEVAKGVKKVQISEQQPVLPVTRPVPMSESVIHHRFESLAKTRTVFVRLVLISVRASVSCPSIEATGTRAIFSDMRCSSLLLRPYAIMSGRVNAWSLPASL